jgi:hypothetical protein
LSVLVLLRDEGRKGRGLLQQQVRDLGSALKASVVKGVVAFEVGQLKITAGVQQNI